MRKNYETAADVKFIRERYPELAAAVWYGYKKAGRGFLLISANSADAFPATKDTLNLSGSILKGTLDAAYVPISHLEQHDAEYINDEILDILDQYDEHWEIVLVIEHEDRQGWSNYRFIGPVKPQVAYRTLREQMAARQNRHSH